MARTIRDVLVDLSVDSGFEALVDHRLANWWRRLSEWPPDVFAITSVLLSETATYRLAVSPPEGNRWPPRAKWNSQVEKYAKQWWNWIAGQYVAPPPKWLAVLGCRIRAAGGLALHEFSGDWNKISPAEIAKRWRVVCAVLELHAIADEASAGFGMPSDPDDSRQPETWQECRLGANNLLAATDTLSNFSKERISVLPKMRTTQAGITLRSLSAHLAVTRSREVDVLWAHTPAFKHDKASFNLLLIPTPFKIEAKNFEPTTGSLDNMDREHFGFFKFEPDRLDLDAVERIMRCAADRAGSVDGVVLPELSVTEEELLKLRESIEDIFKYRSKSPQSPQVPFLFAGVRGPRTNRIHFTMYAGEIWREYPQFKHHRWCLDRTQIENYRIGAALHPSVRWWEDIEIKPRQLRFIIANSWLGLCPLICEDLARQDPVAEIIRTLGPTLVLALLLDGPQLAGRWPARYATVLADDPGSSVLTFTALGMAERSVPPGASPKRVVGMWKDVKTGLRELHLDAGASALLITLCNEWAVEWMADGRSDRGTAAQLYLGNVEQLAIP